MEGAVFDNSVDTTLGQQTMPLSRLGSRRLGYGLIALEASLLLTLAALANLTQTVNISDATGLVPEPHLLWLAGCGAMLGYVALVLATGGYSSNAVLHPRRYALRLVLVWIGCLTALAVGLHLTENDIVIERTGLGLIAVGAPLAMLAMRRFVAYLAKPLIASEQIASERVFVVAEAAAHPMSSPSEASAGQAMVVSSLASMNSASLEAMLQGIRSGRPEEVHLVAASGKLGPCPQLLAALRRLALPVRLVASVPQPAFGDRPAKRSNGRYVYLIQRAPLRDRQRLVKRLVDIAGASALLLLIAPVLLVISVAVATTSRGPILFRQARTGLNGRAFTIYKFRTMTVLENGHDVRQATQGDPRVTTVGRTLRKWSLDELPQLFNVLKGDMSLIGPRPHAVAHDLMFAARVPDYELRFRVKPGITGLAQVYGFRGETSSPGSIEGRVQLDLHYIDGWTLWTDAWILARTVTAVTIPTNAF